MFGLRRKADLCKIYIFAEILHVSFYGTKEKRKKK